MAEPHVLSALKQRRAEIAGELRCLTSALTHLDATIQLFEQGRPPKAKQRQISRAVFQVMREAAKPITSTEIAERIGAPEKRVMGVMSYQRDRGRVKGNTRIGREIGWEITK